ncbi:MAG TPA: DUF5946 family protein [Candidatus Eremiobacteraceae bacterium]|nr:DUF5946 family protein [Candidatus Eremiobacteraceae bacterium]
MVARCSGCGLATPSGDDGCQVMFDELGARAIGDYRYARFRRLVTDAYCAQHPHRYCRSVKSLVAHLCGLCCALEYGASPRVYDALQRSLNGYVSIEKPALPEFRGAATIGDVAAAGDVESYERCAWTWARDVWNSYATLHPFARLWLEAIA